VIPGGKNAVPIIVLAEIDAFYQRTVRRIIPGNIRKSIFGRNRLDVLGDSFFNNLFETWRTAAILAKIKWHNWRKISTPAIFILCFRAAGKLRSAY